MKKIFTLTILSVCLFCNVTANAQSLYGGNVSDVIDAFKLVGNKFDFRVWGTEYYTYKGIKRCEVHFGNSQNNLVRFRLNNDDSVERMLITYPTSSLHSGFNGGMLAGVACAAFGVDDNDFTQAWTTLLKDIIDNAYSNYMHKKYSLWSNHSRQYVVMDVEVTSSKVDFYFYAE